MRDAKSLKIWQKSHSLTLRVYQVTRSFPKEELYGLTSQLRRASHSIPSNICEGCGCDTIPEFARYIQYAVRSAYEAEYHLLLAHDLG